MGQEQHSRHTRRQAASVWTDATPLFDLIPAPAYIFDDETLRFLAVNAAAMGRYGYSAHRPRGTVVSIAIPLGGRRQLPRNERE